MSMELITVGSGSKGNCHIFQCEGEQILLDCGTAHRHILVALKYDFRQLQYILTTHHHQDHIRALHRLVDIDPMMGVCKPWEIEEGETLTYWEKKPSTEVAFKIGNFRVYPIPLKSPSTGQWLHNDAHYKKASGECPIYAYLVWGLEHCLFYVTDCAYVPYKLTRRAINTMLIGCNYTDDVEISAAKAAHVYRGHLGLNTVKEMIRVNQTPYLKHVILCHVSADADVERMIREVKEVVGDGVTVDIAEAKKVIKLED